jgi:hypothetical protein
MPPLVRGAATARQLETIWRIARANLPASHRRT